MFFFSLLSCYRNVVYNVSLEDLSEVKEKVSIKYRNIFFFRIVYVIVILLIRERL